MSGDDVVMSLNHVESQPISAHSQTLPSLMKGLTVQIHELASGNPWSMTSIQNPRTNSHSNSRKNRKNRCRRALLEPPPVRWPQQPRR